MIERLRTAAHTHTFPVLLGSAIAVVLVLLVLCGLGTALQAGIAFAGAWVAWETRVLRLQGAASLTNAQDQLGLLRQQTLALEHQLRLASVPDHLEIAIYPMDASILMKTGGPPLDTDEDRALARETIFTRMIRSAAGLTSEDRHQELRLFEDFKNHHNLGASDLVMICTIFNPTDLPANSVFLAVFDRRLKAWLCWGEMRQSLRPGDRYLVPISSKIYPSEQIMTAIANTYGPVSQSVDALAGDTDEWMCLLWFRAAHGAVYVARRRFMFGYGPNELGVEYRDAIEIIPWR